MQGILEPRRIFFVLLPKYTGVLWTSFLDKSTCDRTGCGKGGAGRNSIDLLKNQLIIACVGRMVASHTHTHTRAALYKNTIYIYSFFYEKMGGMMTAVSRKLLTLQRRRFDFNCTSSESGIVKPMSCHWRP